VQISDIKAITVVLLENLLRWQFIYMGGVQPEVFSEESHLPSWERKVWRGSACPVRMHTKLAID